MFRRVLFVLAALGSTTIAAAQSPCKTIVDDTGVRTVCSPSTSTVTPWSTPRVSIPTTRIDDTGVYSTFPALPRIARVGPPSLVGADGTYLGVLSNNPYDPNSVSNPYGRYGSPYSPTSVNNPYGKYGSPYSPQSATNPYATQPPLVVNPYLGRLSANPYLRDSISNPYGPYGSPFSPSSITNPYSIYGSPFSPSSVTNPFAIIPPE